MMISNSSLIVVGIFIFITLVIGLYAGKDIKDFKDYVLGNRRFSILSLVLTFLATYIGGGATIGTVGEVYSIGIIIIVAYLGNIIKYLIFAYVIGNKISHFKNKYTLGDIIKQLYGRKAQVFIGLLTVIYTLGHLSLQIYLIGKILHHMLNINLTYGIIFSGIIMGIYTSFGGIKAVTYTDVLQFLILIIVFPTLAFLLVKKVGGYESLFLNVNPEKFNILNNKKLLIYVVYFFTTGIFLKDLSNPAFMQRIFMAKNKFQIKNLFLTTAFLDPIFRLTVMIIGLSASILFPNLQPKEVLFQVINTCFDSDIMKGISIAGIIATIMSTADSFMHAGGVVISNDIANKRTLTTAKLSTFGVAVLSTLLALFSQNINFRYIDMTSSLLAGPIIFAPVFFGILQLKVDKKSFWLSILCGAISFLILNYTLDPEYRLLSILLGIISNVIFFFTYHIIKNKGIALMNRHYEQEKSQKILRPSVLNIKQAIYFFFSIPNKIFEYSRKSVVRCEANNMLFGIFVCINFIVPYFMWDHENEKLYNLMIYLRFFGGLLGGLLIVKSEWKDFLKPYFHIFWHFSLLYCLPFISTVMFLLTQGSLIWIMNIGTSIFFLILLSEIPIFLILNMVGIAAGIIFYKFVVGPINIFSFGFEISYHLIYEILFTSIIALLFSYKKNIFNTMKGNIGTNLSLAMTHELRNTGLYIYPASQISLMHLKKNMNNYKIVNEEKMYFINKKDFQCIQDQNIEIERLSNLQKNIVRTFENLLVEYKESINDPQNFSMKNLLKKTIDQFSFKSGQKEKLLMSYKNDFIVKVPKHIFIFVLDNILKNSYNYGNPTQVKIWLQNNEIHIKDNGKKISESEIEKIFQMRFTDDIVSAAGIGLPFAKQIIEGIGGQMWIESGDNKTSSVYTEFIIKFPKIYEDLCKEEKVESIKNDTKKSLAKAMKEHNISNDIIKKSTGYFIEDLD